MLPFSFSGTLSLQLRSFYHLIASVVGVPWQRAMRGPKRPGWTTQFEVATAFWRLHMRYTFDLPDIQASRQFFDTVHLRPAVLDQLSIENEPDPTIKGRWFRGCDPRGTLLYLRGGG